jgi:hypothetical protein
MPVRKGRFHRGCTESIKGLLCSDDYRVGEGVDGFQSIGKVDIDDSSEKSVGEEGDISIVIRVRGMVRVVGESIRGGKLSSWNMVKF